MNYEESFEYLINKGVTAYELHIFSGKAESGLRKLLNREVSKPNRKTKDVIIKYANILKNEENQDSYEGELQPDIVEKFVIQNKDHFFNRPKIKVIVDNILSKEIVRISRDPELFKKYFK